MIVYIQEEVELHLFVSVDLAIEDARAISRALRLYGMRAPNFDAKAKRYPLR